MSRPRNLAIAGYVEPNPGIAAPPAAMERPVPLKFTDPPKKRPVGLPFGLMVWIEAEPAFRRPLKGRRAEDPGVSRAKAGNRCHRGRERSKAHDLGEGLGDCP